MTLTYLLILLACAAGPVLILAALLGRARRDLAETRAMLAEARLAYRVIRNLYKESQP